MWAYENLTKSAKFNPEEFDYEWTEEGWVEKA
jgi:hypothetical protein